jgi:hypothetical protein
MNENRARVNLTSGLVQMPPTRLDIIFHGYLGMEFPRFL